MQVEELAQSCPQTSQFSGRGLGGVAEDQQLSGTDALCIPRTRRLRGEATKESLNRRLKEFDVKETGSLPRSAPVRCSARQRKDPPGPSWPSLGMHSPEAFH